MGRINPPHPYNYNFNLSTYFTFSLSVFILQFFSLLNQAIHKNTFHQLCLLSFDDFPSVKNHYFAYSTDRVSLITITFICPG